MVAVWVENIIVLDRAQMLVEAGLRVSCGCVFEPASSPRCFAITASK
jgi:hypothetical protein